MKVDEAKFNAMSEALSIEMMHLYAPPSGVPVLVVLAALSTVLVNVIHTQAPGDQQKVQNCFDDFLKQGLEHVASGACPKVRMKRSFDS